MCFRGAEVSTVTRQRRVGDARRDCSERPIDVQQGPLISSTDPTLPRYGTDLVVTRSCDRRRARDGTALRGTDSIARRSRCSSVADAV